MKASIPVLLALWGCTADADRILDEAALAIELRGLAEGADRVEIRIERNGEPVAVHQPHADEPLRVWFRTLPRGMYDLRVIVLDGDDVLQCHYEPFESLDAPQRREMDLADATDDCDPGLIDGGLATDADSGLLSGDGGPDREVGHEGNGAGRGRSDAQRGDMDKEPPRKAGESNGREPD